MGTTVDRLSLGYLTVDTDPLTTIDAAARAGFRALGIRITGRRFADSYARVIGNGPYIAEMSSRMDDLGLSLTSVSAYHLYEDIDTAHLEQVLDTSAALGANIVVSNSYMADEVRFFDVFCSYCDLAAQRGIRLVIEPMRYSGVKSLAAAARIVNGSGRDNAGLLIDPLHLDRAGEDPSDVRRIDPGRIFLAQLCDAQPRPAASEDELRQEARTARLYPGAGQLPLDAFLAALPGDVWIEVETPRPELTQLEPWLQAEKALSAAKAFLETRSMQHERPG